MNRTRTRLAPHVRPQTRRFAIAFSLLVVSFGVELIGPWLVQRAVDGPLLNRGDDARGDLIQCFAGLLAIAWIGSAIGYSYARTTARAGQGVVLSLRVALARHLSRVDLRWLENRRIGRTVTQVTTDVENLDTAVTTGALQAGFDLLRLVGFSVALLVATPWLGLYLFVLLPTLAVVALRFRGVARESYGAVRRSVAAQNGFLLESLRGAATLRAYGADAATVRAYGERNDETRSAWIRTVGAYARFFATTDATLRLGQAGLLLLGAHQVSTGVLTPGELVRAWLYLQLLSRPLRELGERFHVLQAAASSLERILDVLDEPESPVETANPKLPDAEHGRIELHSLSFGYSAERPVVTDLSLTLPEHTTTALVGATGSGKSTMLRLLARLHDPDQGEIKLDGVPLESWTETELRSRIRLVPQDPLLTGETLGEALSDENSTSSPDEVLARLERFDPEARLGRDLDRPIGKDGRDLSRGERQLVALLRALATDPRVILLDEPTASMDPDSESAVARALQQLPHDPTILVVAHRLETVRRADQVLVLERGRLVEAGEPNQLAKGNGPFAALLRKASDSA